MCWIAAFALRFTAADVNALVHDSSPIKIPNVLVKWITYALVLHIVALILAGISAIFGLLAHIREFSMVCCSTCISGFAAAVALFAFIFDIALFFIVKSRINSVKSGSATMGAAIWMTLAAWLLLFFAGCFFGLGRCCISRRPRDHEKRERAPTVDDRYADQMRLDAVKAEADRKARQQKQEVGLPAFQEYEQTQPLTSKLDTEEYVEDGDQILPYRPNAQGAPGVGAGVGAGTAAYARTGTAPPGRQFAGGYAQGAPGSRAMDDYYNARPSQPNAYPPQPRRQTSGHTQSSSAYSAASGYAPTPAPPVPTISPPANDTSAQYLMPGAAYGHNQYASATSQSQGYGHPERSNTCKYLSSHRLPATLTSSRLDLSAATHQQYPTDYSARSQQPVDNFSADTYNNLAQMALGATSSAYPAASPYAPNTAYSTPAPSFPAAPAAATHHAPERSYTQSTYPATPQPHVQERSYTLGGDAYGAAGGSNPQAAYADDAYYARYSGSSRMTSPYSPLPTPSPSHVDTAVAPAGGPHGPRSPASPTMPQPQAPQPVYEDSPPMYDDATAQPPGQWNSKH